ncbi:MAG: hypothetical protein WC866_06125 [Patescibacteria group bacterium]|jgi:hypothetical protein
MRFITALLIFLGVIGLPIMLLWQHQRHVHRAHEAAVKALLSRYIDGIIRLTVVGPPAFHEITMIENTLGGKIIRRLYRIFLRPALGFTIEACWEKNRWEYSARFFDPLEERYQEFPIVRNYRFHTPWFEAKAETLMQVLEAYMRHPLVKSREGGAFSSDFDRVAALFNVTKWNTIDYEAFFQSARDLRPAA